MGGLLKAADEESKRNHLAPFTVARVASVHPDSIVTNYPSKLKRPRRVYGAMLASNCCSAIVIERMDQVEQTTSEFKIRG